MGGGAVASQVAEVVARHFGEDGTGGQHMEGLENVRVKVAGLCTLNGALDVSRFPEGVPFPALSAVRCRALCVCGDADQVVPPEATIGLFEALPLESKRLLRLEGGTHDLFTTYHFIQLK